MLKRLWNWIFDIREGEDELGRRLRRHGTRGMWKVGSSEGNLVSPEDAKKLTPPS